MISTLKQLGVGSSQALFAWLPASENVNQAPKSKKRKREERRSSAQAELEGHNDEAFSQNEHDLAHVGNGHADDATLAQPKKKKKRKNMLEGERESIQSVVEKPRWEEGFGDDAGHEDGARSRQKKKRKSRNHPQEDQQGSIHPITAQVSNTGETAGEDVVKDSQFEMEDQAITKSKKRKKPRKSTTVEDTSIHDPITGYDLHGESSQLDSRAEDTLATSKKKKSRKNKFADEDSIAETEGLEVLSNRMPEGEYDNEEASVKSKKSHRSGNNIVREGSVTRHLQDLDSTHGNVQVTATPPKPKEKAGGARRDEEDLAALEPVLDSEAIFTSTLNDALGKRQPAPLKAPALTKKQKKRARKDRELSRNENLLSVGKTNTSHAEDIDEVRHYSVPGMLPPAMSSSTPVGSSMTKATTLRKPKAKTPIMMPKISSSQSSLAPNRPPKKPVEQPRNAFSTPNTSQRNRPSKQSSNATPSSARTPKAPANELSFAVVYPSETPQDSVRPVSTPGNAGKTPVADLEAIDRVVEIFRESHGMTQFDMNALIWQPQKEVNELQKEFWNIFPETVPHLMDTKRLRRTVRSRHHNFNKGPWSVEEDEELRNLYGSFPNQWVKLSGLINRPPNAIKTRWKQVLINGDNLIGLRGMVRWTLAEEMKLRDAVADCIKHIQELRRSNKEFAKKAQGQSDEELIHWQTVSDKMGRTRSFPKCIAKWKQLQARAAEEGDNLNEYTPSSRSGKRYVEDAKRIARDLQAPEILQMLYAIRVTEAGSESKIPWDRVMGAIQFSTGRGIRSLAHSTCFRKLREKVPGSEDMRLREVLDVLIDAFETSEPEIPDQLRDHEYIRPVERKVKRQSLRKKRRASSKYVQDDYSIGQSPNPNGEISLQAGDDTEINNPVDVQEVADEEAPSEQRRRKKQKSDVVPEGNEETPQLSQKKKKRNSKAVGDEGLNGDSAGGVDHQGPAETSD
ncbi:hypothetical protein BJ875DRAFT_208624 [Amylocarpus encephaloides]|uniref:Myb-like domain-containing protein n=1 Tax=Amylocarpus encephaloides TaxID=45428 RepID=A0A9P8C0Q1_9HELO|nr:hypothetical protein BJ875DRAFT_208624 [Amylocarpus encephaloides]